MIAAETSWSRAMVMMEIKRVEALVADLRRLAAGEYPSPEDRAAAVQIWDAERVMRAERCLSGRAKLPAGRPRGRAPRDAWIKVSDLVVGDLAMGWVRNRYGLYRLGWEKSE